MKKSDKRKSVQKKSKKLDKRKSVQKKSKKSDKNIKKHISKKNKKVEKKYKQKGGDSWADAIEFIEQQQVPIGTKFKVIKSREPKKDYELQLKKDDIIYIMVSPTIDRMMGVSLRQFKKELDKADAVYLSIDDAMKKFIEYALSYPKDIPKELYGKLLGWVPYEYIKFYYEDDGRKDEYDEDELIEEIIDSYKNNNKILKTARISKEKNSKKK